MFTSNKIYTDQVNPRFQIPNGKLSLTYGLHKTFELEMFRTI